MREALRALCGAFDSSYRQRIDLARGYPEEFVAALTEAGWLAALIPLTYSYVAEHLLGLPRSF